MPLRSLAFVALMAIPVAGFSLNRALSAEFPPFEKVTEGYKQIEPPSDEPISMYTVFVNEKDGQVLLELPKNFSTKDYFIGMTVASGEVFAGLQAGDFYVQWRQYNQRLALIAPRMDIRSGGDNESKDSVKRLFTGQVLLDLPILTLSPRGGPVIDGDALLVSNASTFFGSRGRSRNPGLAKIVKAKVFPRNIELAFEMPNSAGNLQTLYYSISEIQTSPSYKPRVADQRIGYFTTSYSDFGKYQNDDVDVNYINRWHLEKRDPSLSVSPPKEPITFYLEHTTPVRYRRWVKAGVEYWNEAFERVGISDAIVVNYQDKVTGAHMDKDPEDVRYNFIRWLNNDISTAIGPSRVHPETGQILDADIILTDGWIRYFNDSFSDYMPLIAMEGMSAESLAWLAEHPNWDPRVRFAEPGQRQHVAAKIRSQLSQAGAGFESEQWKTPLLGDDPLDGLIGRTSQVNGMCMASTGRRVDTSVMRMILAMGSEAILGDPDGKAEPGKKKRKKKEDDSKEGDDEDEAKDKDGSVEEKDEDSSAKDDAAEVASDDKAAGEDAADAKKDAPEKKPEESMLDGMPESFIGPLLADLVAHEVGHTLGLRHNFKASSVYNLDEINSDSIKGKEAFAGSVMDYLPINLRLEEGEVQGDFAMIKVGPYDLWAIEYGYTFDKNPEKILERVSEPELQFATDEDTMGPDPLARRYDFSKQPLEYAQEQRVLIERFREKLMTDYVKSGDSWTKAREGYELTLSLQMKNTGMMANWIGGAFINRDKKGDPKERLPIEVVPAETQRDALKFVLESTFRDDAFALSPELLARLTKDFFGSDVFRAEPAWPVHDKILAMQASALTLLMRAETLQRVYDNEFRTPADQDAFTLPELLDTISGEIWSELSAKSDEKFTTRKPKISSLRRNLQREHVERLIDLTLPTNSLRTPPVAYKAISNLCVMQLLDLQKRIDVLLESADSLDPYSRAHLYEASQRIGKALEAEYVYNQAPAASAGSGFFFIGDSEDEGQKSK